MNVQPPFSGGSTPLEDEVHGDEETLTEEEQTGQEAAEIFLAEADIQTSYEEDSAEASASPETAPAASQPESADPFSDDDLFGNIDFSAGTPFASENDDQVAIPAHELLAPPEGTTDEQPSDDAATTDAPTEPEAPLAYEDAWARDSLKAIIVGDEEETDGPSTSEETEAAKLKARIFEDPEEEDEDPAETPSFFMEEEAIAIPLPPRDHQQTVQIKRLEMPEPAEAEPEPSTTEVPPEPETKPEPVDQANKPEPAPRPRRTRRLPPPKPTRPEAPPKPTRPLRATGRFARPNEEPSRPSPPPRPTRPLRASGRLPRPDEGARRAPPPPRRSTQRIQPRPQTPQGPQAHLPETRRQAPPPARRNTPTGRQPRIHREDERDRASTYYRLAQGENEALQAAPRPTVRYNPPPAKAAQHEESTADRELAKRLAQTVDDLTWLFMDKIGSEQSRGFVHAFRQKKRNVVSLHQGDVQDAIAGLQTIDENRQNLEAEDFPLQRLEKMRRETRRECIRLMELVLFEPDTIQEVINALGCFSNRETNYLGLAENIIRIANGIPFRRSSSQLADAPKVEQKALDHTAALMCMFLFKRNGTDEALWEKSETFLDKIAQTAFQVGSIADVNRRRAAILAKEWLPEGRDRFGAIIPKEEIKICRDVLARLRELKEWQDTAHATQQEFDHLYTRRVGTQREITLPKHQKERALELFDIIHSSMAGVIAYCHEVIAAHNSPDGRFKKILSMAQEQWVERFKRMGQALMDIQEIETYQDPKQQHVAPERPRHPEPRPRPTRRTPRIAEPTRPRLPDDLEALIDSMMMPPEDDHR